VFSIGDFSKITGLTVKTLRFYQEQGLLQPSWVDAQTGYRYFAAEKIEEALVIKRLRELDLPLAQIAEILRTCDDEADLLGYLQRHRTEIEAKLAQFRQIRSSLDQIITHQLEVQRAMQQSTFQVEEKHLPAMLIAAIRIKGKYSESGPAFARIGRKYGRHICGPCFLLHYDHEYREDDADFEACMPIRKGASAEEISVRELPGGACVSLRHRGPWDELGRSYAVILSYIAQRRYAAQTPTREVYLKGPGMIFRGNPKKYLTEIQIVFDAAATVAAADLRGERSAGGA
jgi:DNA-binding transcriptional MerR regulator/DNA gyrase inhibitor GyrI